MTDFFFSKFKLCFSIFTFVGYEAIENMKKYALSQGKKLEKRYVYKS